MTAPIIKKEAHFQQTELIHEGKNTQIFRVFEKERAPVIFKVLKKSSSEEELKQFFYEYHLLKNRNLEFAPRFLNQGDQELFQSSPFFKIEDFGGIPLFSHFSPGKFNAESFLPLMMKLVLAIEEIHEKKLIHNQIHPGHILWNPETKQLKLIDFSLAKLYGKNSRFLENAKKINFAYVSPELSQRMLQPLDYRSDYYALGVTLYEILTGKLPFFTLTPKAWMHNHFVDPPSGFSSSLFKQIGEIIVKLLSQNPDHRYHSLFELKTDLDSCLLDKDKGNTPELKTSLKQNNNKLKKQIIQVMNLSLSYWEEETQKGKIDFAEQSKIWKVHLDKTSGTFRTRVLDRYLDIMTIPKKPRWKEVYNTVNFVLGSITSISPLRTQLEKEFTLLEKYLPL